MTILIFQQQISQRKRQGEAKIDAESLLSASSALIAACVEREGVWRTSVCGSVPLCFARRVRFAWVSIPAGWTSALCPTACAVARRVPPETGVLLQPPHIQTGSEERRHHVEGGVNRSGALGEKKQAHARTRTHTHTQI